MTIDFFVPFPQLPNGTYREMGIWCGNFLFARIIMSPVIRKTGNQNYLVKYIFSITQ